MFRGFDCGMLSMAEGGLIYTLAWPIVAKPRPSLGSIEFRVGTLYLQQCKRHSGKGQACRTYEEGDR
jgi:hypothetical protein